MNGFIGQFILAFSSGLLGALQGSLNAQIGKVQGQYLMIIGVSLVQVMVATLLLLRNGSILFSINSLPYIFVAGVLGVVIMFGISFSIASIGSLSVAVLVIFGQIIASAVINHFGFLGLPRSPLTTQKLLSILVIMIGVGMLLKSSK